LQAVQQLLASRPCDDAEHLFTGQRGPLTVPSVHRLVKGWCRMINLKGNYGSHTLRKTWGYHQRVTFGVDIPRLMVCFNHSTQKQTLDYLCVTPQEIRDVYENEL
jgi:integrase